MTAALLDLDIGEVINGSRDLVRRLKEVNRIRKLFRSGLQWTGLPLAGARYAEVLKDGEALPEKDNKKPKVERVGRIVTEADFANELGPELRKAGLVFYIVVDAADA